MKKRLFFDATPIIDRYISGVGKVLLETLRALDTEYYSQKYDIFIFVPINEAKKLERFSFKYIKTKWLPYPHKFFGLFSRFKFGPPIDVFLGEGTYIFENYRNWNLLLSKSITYIHDPAFKLYPEYIQKRNLDFLSKYINLWIQRTDKIVTVSESAKSDIKEALNVNDAVIVHNASSPEMAPKSKKEIDRALSKWGIPKRYYVYLGNIEPRKNLVNLIKAFSEYSTDQNSQEALVLIGGDGWNNDEIYKEIEKTRAAGVNIVKPASYVPDEDIPALLSGAIALLQLSWHEGFGMSVLHSLACGTPVVAADIPSLREAAIGNEQNAVFVDPASTRDISKAINDVKKIPHRRHPQNIPSWSESVKDLEKIIDKL